MGIQYATVEYSVSKLTLSMKTMELHVYHSNTNDNSRPHHTRASQRWWVGFKQRHPEIVLRTPHALEKERQKQTKQQIIDEYFDKLEKLYQQHKYEPHQIYAGDEVGIDGDGIDTKKVIARKGTHMHHRMRLCHRMFVCLFHFHFSS